MTELTLYKDAINGTFELAAGFFVLNHCRVLYAHKEARGVSLLSVAFFTLWGFWNLYYYPALNQPLSFYGGLFITLANAIYISMMLTYRSIDSSQKPKQQPSCRLPIIYVDGKCTQCGKPCLKPARMPYGKEPISPEAWRAACGIYPDNKKDEQ